MLKQLQLSPKLFIPPEDLYCKQSFYLVDMILLTKSKVTILSVS